jgi:hypothetical protein
MVNYFCPYRLINIPIKVGAAAQLTIEREREREEGINTLSDQIFFFEWQCASPPV